MDGINVSPWTNTLAYLCRVTETKFYNIITKLQPETKDKKVSQVFLGPTGNYSSYAWHAMFVERQVNASALFTFWSDGVPILLA